MAQFKQTACLASFIAVVISTQTNAWGQTDGIHRLLNRAEVLEARELDNDHRSTSNDSVEDSFVHPAAALVPSDHFSKVSARTFPSRQDTVVIEGTIIEGTIQPVPLSPEDASARHNVGPLDRKVFKASEYRFHPHSTPQEYVFDGNDRGLKIQVDQDFNIYGLDTEDTFGHFDTLDGQRIVVPSNRVAIYAPRFGAVRKIDGAVNAQYNQPTVGFYERDQTVQATDTRETISTKQYEMAARSHGGSRASGFIDQTRGVAVRRTLAPLGARNYQSLILGEFTLEIVKIDKAIGAQLQAGLQAAVAWETDLGLQVFSKGIQPVIVRDLTTAQELLHIESENDPRLQVVKTANVLAARAGDQVEFMIRFDNISNQKIGNVTLVDNLTRRLEYVEGSSECTLKSEFISDVNESESLALRWEITEPVEPGTGGVIRFRCRVR